MPTLVLALGGAARADTPTHRATIKRVIAAAERTQAVQSFRREHRDARRPAPYWDGVKWNVAYYTGGRQQLEVVMTSRDQVVHIWTGLESRAPFTRGGFGGTVDAPWLWVPCCLLFLAPFVDPRRPFRMLHLDLLALLGFGVSYGFLSHGAAAAAIWSFYPVLLYLLGRMLWTGFRGRRQRGRLVPYATTKVLVIGLVALTGARIGLNLSAHTRLDISYASVVGADRIWHKEPLYVDDNAHPDTYGPLMYAAYVPFELAFPWKGNWDYLPAAHAAAIAFDLLTLLGLVLLGRRLRAGPQGTRLGLALAWAFAAFPFTLFGLMESTNDGLIAMLLVWMLVVFSSPAARGALVGAAAAAKFFPGALLPLVAFGPGERDRRKVAASLAVGAGIFVFAVWMYLPAGGLRAFWNCTLGYQLTRPPDFSLWALHSGIGWTKTVLEALAIGLAVVVSFVPRRRSLIQAAALAAAVTIALQLPAGHWFYLYIVWFMPLVLVALFGAYLSEDEPDGGELQAGRLHEQVDLVGVARAREEHQLVGA
ncbi:MAG TPA: glycosyltransferase 87 family protein [Thermoleophilaceae bacterium]